MGEISKFLKLVKSEIREISNIIKEERFVLGFENYEMVQSHLFFHKFLIFLLNNHLSHFDKFWNYLIFSWFFRLNCISTKFFGKISLKKCLNSYKSYIGYNYSSFSAYTNEVNIYFQPNKRFQNPLIKNFLIISI